MRGDESVARIPRRQVLRGAAAGAVGVALTQTHVDTAAAAPVVVDEMKPTVTTAAAIFVDASTSVLTA